MRKRIIAVILSFILFMNSSVSVFATDVGSVFGNVSTVENNVSGNVIVDETQEDIGTTEQETTSEEESSVMEAESEEETVEPETEETVENETEEKTTVLETESEEETVAEQTPAMQNDIVQEAKESLRKLVEEKDIYAVVYLTDSYAAKVKPSKEADTVAILPSAKTVQILDVEVVREYSAEHKDDISTVWYYTRFYVGETIANGYVEEEFLAYSDELLTEWKKIYNKLFSPAVSEYSVTLATSYKDIEQFPSSYQIYLRKLKDKYPNWVFVPMNVNRDWDDCVDEQMGDYSWIYYDQPAKFRGKQINSKWYYASREGIAYYMDPRNFLTDGYIFQFEQNTYNESYHSQSALQTFLSNTFMKGKVPDDSLGRTYAKVIYDSGKSRGLSPFNLAARVIQEQGINGTSAMISGTYPGFENLYNHYNISASGTTDEAVIRSGLTYAREKGWNTRVKSLEGGAAFIGNNYILKGQDTLYLQKFDIEHGLSALHQYMQNIMAPYTEGMSMRKMYNNAGSLSSAFVFKIPVFNDMPKQGYEMATSSPVKLKKGETKQLSIKYNGTNIQDLTIFSFVSLNPDVATVSTTGKITAVGSGEDRSGKTTIRVTLKEDSSVFFDVSVVVTCPLVDIELEMDKRELYLLTENAPDKIPYLEDGVTKYYDKEDCANETAITVLYKPEDTTDSRKVNWTIEDETIVSYEVLEKENASVIKLTAKAGGTTKVTAKVGKIKKSVDVSVRVPMTDAWVNENEVRLLAGQRRQLTTSHVPYNTTDIVEPEWKSRDESVVKIEDGEIVAVGAGSTVVQAVVGPFSMEGLDEDDYDRLSCIVTVEECSITFVDEHDSVLAEASGVYGEKLTSLYFVKNESETDWNPWTLTREGFVFVGWYTQKNGEGNPVTQDTVLYGSMTLYPYFVSESESFHVKPIGSIGYTGGYLKPPVTVYDGKSCLIEGVHYTVTYVNNKDVYNVNSNEGLPKAVVKGRGIYTGHYAEENFLIIPKSITDIDVTSANIVVAYNGKPQKIQPFVMDAGRILQKDKDYTLDYPAEYNSDGSVNENAYIQPGTYPIAVTGKGNYVGTRMVYITITKRVSVADLSVSEIKDVTYNDGDGFESEEKVKAWEPKPIITYDKKTLVEGVDYTLNYSDNKEIGTAYITITGKGNYIGTRKVIFKIKGNDIATVTLSGIQNKEYTSEEIVLDSIVVTNKKKKVLKEGVDYKLSFENNVEVGKAYVVITGVNGFDGIRKTPFYIEPYHIGDNKQTYRSKDGSDKPAFEVVCDETIEYERSGAKPSVKAYFKGEELEEGIDYKLSYKNNHQIGEGDDKPTVLITGKNRFTGIYEQQYLITAKDISAVTMNVKDVKFRNRKGFCFAEPVLRDAENRRLKAGVDYSEELLYTYATDVVLYDGTIRLAGEVVEENDIPTPGELEDAIIKVTAKGIGNYTSEISATYRIIKNTSWFDDWTEDAELKLNMNRTKMYLNCLYPEYNDTVRLSASVGELLIEKTTVFCDSREYNGYFSVILTNDSLTVELNKTGENIQQIAGDYVFTITPIVEIEENEVALPQRKLHVNVSDEKPEVSVNTSGDIDLLYRKTTAVMVAMQMSSQKDSFFLPASETEMKESYILSGDCAEAYQIDYENSSFSDEKFLQICIRALPGEDSLSPEISNRLRLQYWTEKGIKCNEDITIVPRQTKYSIMPKTEKCFVKLEEGTGQLLYSSSPADIVYESVSCDNESVTVSLKGRTMFFDVDNTQVYEKGQTLTVNIHALAKDAGKGSELASTKVTLVFCEETELEKLIDSKDKAEKTIKERQKEKTSYKETKEINTFNKKVIAANTVDFSDKKIAFLGDSITEGAGLEKIGVENNVYCSVVEQALNAKEVYRLGYGGCSIGRYWDSLLDKYKNIPSDVDYIFVFAGVNDVYAGNSMNFGSISGLTQSHTFCGDTYELMKALQKEYPDAGIIFLTPLSTITNTWYKEMLPDMLPMEGYVSAMKAIANREELPNVEVWDLYNSNLLDSYDKNVRDNYVNDGVHLNAAGHKILGQHIASELIQSCYGN